MNKELNEVKKQIYDDHLRQFEHITYYVLDRSAQFPNQNVLDWSATIPNPNVFDYCQFLYKIGNRGWEVKQTYIYTVF